MRKTFVAMTTLAVLMGSRAAVALGVRATSPNSDRYGTNFGKHFDDEVRAQKREEVRPKKRSNPKRNPRKSGSEEDPR
jgi:hypothetical protein